MLARLEGISATAAALELGCSRRTIYRDLEALQSEGFTVYADAEGNGGRWRLLHDGAPVEAIPFTHDELSALWLARELLESLDGTPLADGARSALDKLRASLRPRDRARLERIQRILAATGVSRHPGTTTSTAALQSAAEARRTVSIGYRSLAGRASNRHFDPYFLWLDPATATLYTAGWDHQRRAVIVLSIDRIVEVTPTLQRFDPIAGWDARAFLAESFAAFHGPATEVRLCFTGPAARLVAERRWHPSQKLLPRADSLELALRIPLSPGLRAWVLSWTPDVRVLAPTDLAQQVRDALTQGMQAFSPGPVRAGRAARR